MKQSGNDSERFHSQLAYMESVSSVFKLYIICKYRTLVPMQTSSIAYDYLLSAIDTTDHCAMQLKVTFVPYALMCQPLVNTLISGNKQCKLGYLVSLNLQHFVCLYITHI